MAEVRYRDRGAHTIENDLVRVTVMVEGGHIAEITHKGSGVNPLWSPPWPTIEPSTYDPARHPEYGNDAESKLLAGILGHNLCLDQFGPPSAEEAAAGLTVHGEASVLPYEIHSTWHELTARVHAPFAQLNFERKIELRAGDARVYIAETVENTSRHDRPIAWTQHVTLGPPFLEKGMTQFRVPATRSLTIEGEYFDWPNLPRAGGVVEDLRLYTSALSSGGYTSHLLDPGHDEAFFLAWAPSTQVLFGYKWKRSDFPWLGIWEENYGRKSLPWGGKALTRGLEFGVSPIPESRRQMIDRGNMFGQHAFRWIPAHSKLQVQYQAFIGLAEAIPERP